MSHRGGDRGVRQRGEAEEGCRGGCRGGEQRRGGEEEGKEKDRE